MKKVAIILVTMALLFSCVSIPQAEYDEANSLRNRLNHFPSVIAYVQEDFDKAEQDYTQADALIQTKKKLKDAKEMLLVAIESYKNAISVGMPAYAADLIIKIEDLVAQANLLKAEIARPEEYATLTERYELGKTNNQSNNYDSALEQFESVLNDMSELCILVKERYEMSLEEVKQIEAKMKTLNDIVAEIEKIQLEMKNGGKK
ncbi:MAG: hypothetical protein ACRC4W_09575 [Treponemataceae bacterium]